MQTNQVTMEMSSNLKDDQNDPIQTDVECGKQQMLVSEDCSKASSVKTVINMLKASIGVGILALPNIFFKGGYMLTTIFLVTVGVSLYYTSSLMIAATVSIDYKYRFDQTIEHVFGKLIKNFYQILVVTLSAFTCIAYLIYISGFFQIFLQETSGVEISRNWCLILSSLIFIPLSMIEDMKNLYIPSIIGNIIMYFIIFFIIIMAFVNISEDKHQQQKTVELIFGQPIHIPILFGTSVFAFELYTCVSPIRLAMKNPDQISYFLKRVFTFIIILFCCFGIFGCQQLQRNPNSNYFYNFSKQKWMIILEALYAFVLTLSYPLQLFPAIQIITSIPYLQKQISNNPNQNQQQYDHQIQNQQTPNQSQSSTFLYTLIQKIKQNPKQFKLNALKIFINLNIIILTIFAPDFEHVLNIGGAIGGTSIQFVLPVLVYNRYFGNVISKQQKIMNYTIMGFGIVGGITSLFYSIVQSAQK